MKRQKEIHIFVDTSQKMHEMDDKETVMDRVNAFLLGVARRGDRQPAYMHRIHIHIGDEYLPLQIGKAEEKIRESKNLIYRPGNDSDFHENLWSTVLEGDGPDDNLFFILTSGVKAETLNRFRKYRDKVLFMDFSGRDLSMSLNDEQYEQVHVIGKNGARKMARSFHREFLAPYITKVNFGISMNTELVRNGDGNEEDENFNLSEITVVGRASWKTVELLPISGKCFLMPVDECYDKKAVKIKSHEAYNILKQILEPELENLKGIGEEIPDPPLLVACALDRTTRDRRPVILRLHAIDKNDINYDGVLKKAPLEDVDYRKRPPGIPESPASPDSSQMTTSVGQLPKIIPIDAVEDSEEPESPKLVKDDVMDSEDKDDGMRIEVVVLKMTWDTFVDSIAFTDDNLEEVKELMEYEKESDEPELFSDDKLVGWYTSDAVAHHIQKVHRAAKKLSLRQADFDCHVANMLEMMEYSQNPDMALWLADAIRGHGHFLDPEDEDIVEEAARKFDKMYREMKKEENANGPRHSHESSSDPYGPIQDENFDPKESPPPRNGPPAHHQYQFQTRQQFLKSLPKLAPPPKPRLRFETDQHTQDVGRRLQAVHFVEERPQLMEYDMEPQEYPEEHGFEQRHPKRQGPRSRGRVASRVSYPRGAYQGRQGFPEVSGSHEGPQEDQDPQHRPLTQYDTTEHPEEPKHWIAPSRPFRGPSYRGRYQNRTPYENRGARGSGGY